VAHRLPLSTEVYICDAERLRNRHTKAYKLSKAGINLKMLIELHNTPSLIPPYLHNERVPVVQCLYDASAVGFRRHVKDQSVNEVQLEAPETDQLSDADISRIRGSMRRTLLAQKQKLLRRRRRLPFQTELFDDADGAEPFSDEEMIWDDIDGDEDMDLDDLGNDSDDITEDEEDDDDGVHMFMSSNGNIYISMHAHTSDEESVDFDEEDDDDDDDDMVDALEHQQPVNDEVD